MPVQSTPNANELDPGGIGLSPEKDSYTDVYKRVVRDVLSRIDQRLADIAAQAGAPRSTGLGGGNGVPPTGLRRSLRRRVLRGTIGVLMLAGLSTAALAWYYADPATTVMARWVPSFLKTAATNDADASATDSSSSSARPAAPPVQPTDLGSAPQNGSFASGVQGLAEHGDITTASIERDVMPLIQKLARDISDLQVGIEQLKAGQEQVVRDQARAAEQLQAGQDQLMRQMARISAVQPPKPIAPSPQRMDALRPPGAALPPPRPRNANTAQTLFPR